MAIKSPFFLAPLLFAAACSSTVGSDGSGTPGGSGGDPGLGNPDSVAQISGEYEVTTVFDLRNSADLPSIVSAALGPLSDLSNNPAGAILDGTGLGDLLTALPSSVRTLLVAQLNDYIQNKLYQGNSVASRIAQYTDLVSSLLTNFEVVSTLKVGTADAAGNANAEHSLAAMAFMRDGTRQVISTPEIINALSVARDVSVNVDPKTSTINFGDHALKLPLGDFAVTAFHQALQSEFGISDLGAELNSMIDCTALSAQVGPIDVFGFLTITQVQIAGYCTQGISQVAAQVDVQIRRIDMAQVHFTGGDGKLDTLAKADSSGAAKVKSMSGTWQSELAIGSAGITLPAAFKAVRKN